MDAKLHIFLLLTSFLTVITGILFLLMLSAFSTVFENSISVIIALAPESLSCFDISSKMHDHHITFTRLSNASLPAVYSGFRVVNVRPPDNVPSITDGYSGTLGKRAATTSPFPNFNFFLRALPRFLDLNLISSYVYFLPVIAHSCQSSNSTVSTDRQKVQSNVSQFKFSV